MGEGRALRLSTEARARMGRGPEWRAIPAGPQARPGYGIAGRIPLRVRLLTNPDGPSAGHRQPALPPEGRSALVLSGLPLRTGRCRASWRVGKVSGRLRMGCHPSNQQSLLCARRTPCSPPLSAAWSDCGRDRGPQRPLACQGIQRLGQRTPGVRQQEGHGVKGRILVPFADRLQHPLMLAE